FSLFPFLSSTFANRPPLPRLPPPPFKPPPPPPRSPPPRSPPPRSPPPPSPPPPQLRLTRKRPTARPSRAPPAPPTFPRTMTKSIHVCKHPVLQHKMSLLRSTNTSAKDFRDLMREIGLLLAYEATGNLAVTEEDDDVVRVFVARPREACAADRSGRVTTLPACARFRSSRRRSRSTPASGLRTRSDSCPFSEPVSGWWRVRRERRFSRKKKQRRRGFAGGRPCHCPHRLERDLPDSVRPETASGAVSAQRRPRHGKPCCRTFPTRECCTWVYIGIRRVRGGYCGDGAVAASEHLRRRRTRRNRKLTHRVPDLTAARGILQQTRERGSARIRALPAVRRRASSRRVTHVQALVRLPSPFFSERCSPSPPAPWNRVVATLQPETPNVDLCIVLDPVRCARRWFEAKRVPGRDPDPNCPTVNILKVRARREAASAFLRAARRPEGVAALSGFLPMSDDHLSQDWGVKRIKFICVCASKKGLKALSDRHPDVEIFAGVIDEELSNDGRFHFKTRNCPHLACSSYIIPGMGDAGDRWVSSVTFEFSFDIGEEVAISANFNCSNSLF
ncbi:MAG: hypothetical protein BJ554DRAFT_2145, partial [Olpidium bornovanus]